VVEDVLVGGVRRADVGLVVEIGAREPALDRRKLRRAEIWAAQAWRLRCWSSSTTLAGSSADGAGCVDGSSL
jgi:hypothetical protein